MLPTLSITEGQFGDAVTLETPPSTTIGTPSAVTNNRIIAPGISSSKMEDGNNRAAVSLLGSVVQPVDFSPHWLSCVRNIYLHCWTECPLQMIRLHSWSWISVSFSSCPQLSTWIHTFHPDPQVALTALDQCPMHLLNLISSREAGPELLTALKCC